MRVSFKSLEKVFRGRAVVTREKIEGIVFFALLLAPFVWWAGSLIKNRNSGGLERSERAGVVFSLVLTFLMLFLFVGFPLLYSMAS